MSIKCWLRNRSMEITGKSMFIEFGHLPGSSLRAVNFLGKPFFIKHMKPDDRDCV